jgi:hypothetical protein
MKRKAAKRRDEVVPADMERSVAEREQVAQPVL